MMVDQKEDLALSLSLNFPFPATSDRNPSSLQLNLMPTSCNQLNKAPNWFTSYPSSSDRNTVDAFRVETRSFLKGIDVNRTPTTAVEAEEEAGVSSPNSTISSISGKRSERDLPVNENDGERGSGGSDDDDGDNSRKKLRLSKDQSAVLEESFKEHNTLNPKQKLALAKRLGLRPRQVEVWFQNRRARTKLKQTEVDCEFLKRCCENLTDENRRLQKELQELRALKLSPQFYMQMAPPTTLTMCPSCERVAGPSGGSSDKKPQLGDHQHKQRAHVAGMNQIQNNHRAMPFTNPWTTSANQVAQRQMGVLHPRS
uniref:homeobox-leucine zipper protein HAT4 n=1 Tax=Erigeron canadensis TaxID=72917 RepID=UPI001CB95850|nr:homeobox-leucine zipper protein HAT4 [Erigeron canadensis]